MINKNDFRCNYNKAKSQQKTQKTKRNAVTWESESNIKLLYVQSHIPPH